LTRGILHQLRAQKKKKNKKKAPASATERGLLNALPIEEKKEKKPSTSRFRTLKKGSSGLADSRDQRLFGWEGRTKLFLVVRKKHTTRHICSSAKIAAAREKDAARQKAEESTHQPEPSWQRRAWPQGTGGSTKRISKKKKEDHVVYDCSFAEKEVQATGVSWARQGSTTQSGRTKEGVTRHADKKKEKKKTLRETEIGSVKKKKVPC